MIINRLYNQYELLKLFGLVKFKTKKTSLSSYQVAHCVEIYPACFLIK